jgi:5-methylcytosine-specific restriction endonuclease McrA
VPRRAAALLAATLITGAVPATAVALPPSPPTAVASRTALGQLTVRAQTLQPAYDRSAFGTWTSRGGCTTRERVLLRDGLHATAGSGCTVTATHWRSVYDGVIVTVSSQAQIDHVVPLANAWRSGASRWTRERRVRFANDLTDPQLIAVSATSNRAKSDHGPEEWKPPRRQVWCLYARWWIDVKAVWRLRVTSDEKRALRAMLDTC